MSDDAGRAWAALCVREEARAGDRVERERERPERECEGVGGTDTTARVGVKMCVI